MYLAAIADAQPQPPSVHAQVLSLFFCGATCLAIEGCSVRKLLRKCILLFLRGLLTLNPNHLNQQHLCL